MPQHFTALDGARLAYADHGAGTPLLCLAGLTRNMADFEVLLPLLPGIRLIRMDYRGRADSEWTGATTYTIPQEAADALALLDHLGLPKAAILGTSRGGLIGMLIAATAHDRLTGLCMNDIGPFLDPLGLQRIADQIGRNPTARTYAALAEIYPHVHPGFANVPPSRWLEEARRRVAETPDGLVNRYDPALRDAFVTAINLPPVDLWPLYDALAGLPVAVIRGANSDLLSPATLAEMQSRRTDLITATVPDRGHPPFLDEPESLTAIRTFLAALP
jgi:pimeloyl-ACP methyl ester carboxylesterase